MDLGIGSELKWRSRLTVARGGDPLGDCVEERERPPVGVATRRFSSKTTDFDVAIGLDASFAELPSLGDSLPVSTGLSSGDTSV